MGSHLSERVARYRKALNIWRERCCRAYSITLIYIPHAKYDRVQESRLLSKCFCQSLSNVLLQSWCPGSWRAKTGSLPRQTRDAASTKPTGKSVLCHTSTITVPPIANTVYTEKKKLCGQRDEWHQLDDMVYTNIRDSSVTTSPTTMSLLAVIQLWGNYRLVLLLQIHPFFRAIVLL